MRLENRHRQNKRILGAMVCIATTFVFCIVIVLALLLNGQPMKEDLTRNVLGDSASESDDSIVMVERLNLEYSTEDSTFEEYLWQACPVYEWSESFDGKNPLIPKECFSAFGEHMKREKRVLGLNSTLQLLVLDNPMTYERIFRDPQGDRERVLEALSRPECQFANGELIRWDLKETCHADAFANYLNFLRVCRYEGYLSRWIALTEEDQALFESNFNRDPWENLGQEDRVLLIKKHLEHAWVHEECEHSGLPNLEFEPRSADVHLYQMLELVGRRVSEREPALSNDNTDVLADASNEVELAKLFLLAIAARLGDEWARHEYSGSDRWRLDSWDRHVRLEHPWRSRTAILKRFQQGAPSVQQVTDAVNLVLALEDDNMAFDWQYLVNELCKYNVEESGTSTNCQTAIELLERSWDPLTNQRHLSVLSKFRSVALELDIYSSPSIDRVKTEKLY